jgi:hypothetical protein
MSMNMQLANNVNTDFTSICLYLYVYSVRVPRGLECMVCEFFCNLKATRSLDSLLL